MKEATHLLCSLVIHIISDKCRGTMIRYSVNKLYCSPVHIMCTTLANIVNISIEINQKLVKFLTHHYAVSLEFSSASHSENMIFFV